MQETDMAAAIVRKPCTQLPKGFNSTGQDDDVGEAKGT